MYVETGLSLADQALSASAQSIHPRTFRANAELRVYERLIAAYVAPESDRAAIINELIALFDGPAQREAQRLAAEALGEAGENVD